MKIALVYISPNKTTEIITAKLCNELRKFSAIKKVNLGDEKFHNIDDINTTIFKDIDIIGFGSPVFHLRVLKPINVFIKSKAKEIIKVNPSISAFIYVTYSGGTSGKSLLNAAQDLNNMGYKVLGGFKVVAPHFWSSFDNFPEKNKVQLLKCFSTELEKRMNNPPVWKNLKKSLKYQSLLVKIIYPLTKITGKIRELELPIKVDKELCIQCKLCQKECPVVAITVDDFPKIDKSKCIHCFHCVNICPKNAITSDIEKAIKIVEKNRRIVGIEIPQNHIY